MSEEEFKGAFLYWTPDPLAKMALKEWFGDNALKEGGTLALLNRSNAKSYYRKGRHQRNKVVKEHAAETPYTDAIVKEEALERIKKAPWRHLRATLPLFWRGIFLESGFRITRPLSFGIAGDAAVSIMLISVFFFAVIRTIYKRCWEYFGFLFPSVYLIALNTAVSHCLPRYNQPLIPVFIIALLLVLTIPFHQSKTPGDVSSHTISCK